MKFPKKLLEGIFQTEISFFEIEENKKDRVLVINKWPKFSWLENAGLIFLLLFWLLGGVMVTIQASFKIFTIINSGSNFDFDTIFFIIWFLPWFYCALYFINILSWNFSGRNRATINDLFLRIDVFPFYGLYKKIYNWDNIINLRKVSTNIYKSQILKPFDFKIYGLAFDHLDKTITYGWTWEEKDIDTIIELLSTLHSNK